MISSPIQICGKRVASFEEFNPQMVYLSSFILTFMEIFFMCVPFDEGIFPFPFEIYCTEDDDQRLLTEHASADKIADL